MAGKTDDIKRLCDVIFENSEIGIAQISSITGRFIDFNQQFCEITGVTGPELEGRSFQEIFQSAKFSSDPVNLQKLLTGEATRLNSKTRFYRSDGSTAWIKLVLIAIDEPGEKPDQCLVIIENITEQKQLEDKLELADLSLANMCDAIFRISTDGRILDCNNTACQMLGYRPEEIQNMNVADIDEDCVISMRREEIERKRCAPIYCALKTKDGRLLPVELKVNYTVHNGQQYICCVARDISERVRAEDEAAFFKSLIDLSRVPFYVIDPEDGWRITYANKAACDHYGYSLDKLVTMRIPDWDPVFDMNILPKPPFENASREVFQHESLHRSASGELIPVEITTSLIEYDGKIFSCGYFFDISKRKAIETALKESKKNLLEAQRLAHIGNWSVDLSLNLLSASWEFYRIFGFAKEDFPRSFEDYLALVHPDDRERVRLTAGSIPEKASYHQTEYRIVRPDNAVRTIRLNMEAVTDDLGQPVRIDGTAQDVTAQREAEEEKLAMELKLLQNQKFESLGVLAGSIGHDFNNILMAMLGNLELALMNIPEHSKAHTHIRKAIKSGQMASNLTAKMLEYAGKAASMLNDTDLNNILRPNEDLFRSLVSKNVNLSISLNDEIPRIKADHSQILQAVINLLINATEAIGEKPGKITISTGVQELDRKTLNLSALTYKLTEGLFVWVEVSDTGCGMDKTTQLQLFDPFFSTKFTGRGLGMPATLGIIRAHDGAVTIDSKPGQGTTIRFLFPAKKTALTTIALKAAETSHSPDESSGNTILIADDEESVRELCMAFVEQHGYKAIGAANGLEALRLFKENIESIPLVILNMQMPEMDGIQTFHELKQLRNDVRVLFSSGSNEAEIMKFFKDDGPAGFIQKPFLMQELLGKIDQVLKVNMVNSRPK